jgi:arylsulfatase A-like enzyme
VTYKSIFASRRVVATLSLTGLFIAANWTSLAAQSAATRPPDILLIAIDDLNDWIGPLGGHPQARTPNMDRLADRGMVFTNAHTAAPLCNPSRTALMTGLRPSSTGVYGNGPDWRTMEVFEGIRTLPGFFRDAGYATYGAGKLFHAHTYGAAGFFGLNDQTAWDGFYPSLDRQLPDEVGPPVRPRNRNPGLLGFDWAAVATDDRAMGDGQTVNFIETRLADDDEGPRFLAEGIYRPHLPWYVPQAYLDLHPLDTIELPTVIDNDLDDVPEIARVAPLQGNAMHDWVLEQGVWPEAVQAYLASISFADAMVGRLLDALDASGRTENTIVVLFSDHGFHLGEKHRWRKQSLWEEATHVPLIVVAPGLTTPGTRTDAPVSLMDIYPTLVDLAGLDAPGHLEGTSLLPLLEDPGADWDEVALTTNEYMEHAVRDRRYRYIRHADGTEEFYDHQTDPNEWTNLADDPAVAGIKRALATAFPAVNVR